MQGGLPLLVPPGLTPDLAINVSHRFCILFNQRSTARSHPLTRDAERRSRQALGL
jgi:hypothetical protein